MIGGYRVNYSGQRIRRLCALAGMSVADTYLNHNAANKYTKYRYREDRIDRIMGGRFLVRRNVLRSVYDVRSKRGLGGVWSDHVVVIYRLAFCYRWYSNIIVNGNEKIS